MMKTLTGGRVALGLVVSLSLVATALPASPVPPGHAGNAVLGERAPPPCARARSIAPVDSPCGP